MNQTQMNQSAVNQQKASHLQASSGNEVWIPLLDYAVMNNLSTSTLRRYIKSKKIEFKIEKGRYLLRGDSDKNKNAILKFSVSSAPSQANWSPSNIEESMSVFQKVRELEEKLSHANEQISELKMLIAIYEEKLASKA